MNNKLISKSLRAMAIALSLTVGFGLQAFAQDEPATPATETKSYMPKLGGTIQMLGVSEYLKDDFRSDNRVYLFQKQARLNVSGEVENIDYYFLIQFGGEEVPKGRNGNVANTVLSLLEAYVDVPLLSDVLGIRVGQFKVPYSREMMSNQDTLQFADYSINALGFNVGRDVGFALHSEIQNIRGAVGIFTGGGIDIPQRYLPQEMKIPMVVARVGYDGISDDLWAVDQFDPKKTHTGFAVYASGMYEKDSRIGHSSVMSSKQNDVSLFYNTNWNPYLRAVTASQVVLGTLMQFEADAAVQAEIFGFTVNGAGEINYGEYKNSLGTLKMVGGEVQGGVYVAPFQLSLRYAVLFPSSNFGYGATEIPITSDSPIHEINPGMNIYLGNHVKLTMDLQIWIAVPVVTEANLGAYNLMTMPDQAKLVSTIGTVERQNAVTGRLNFQFTF